MLEIEMNSPRRNLSPERKAAYYIGSGMGLLGFILFISTFFSAAMNFGDFNNFEGRTRSMAFRSILGMVLMIAGGFVSGVGRQGLAGSGLMLDPEKQREDLEPWSRSAGGMANDTLSEIGLAKSAEQALNRLGDDDESKQVVKVRCRACQALNDEQAKFCDQCGAAL
jgi:hypothetical protein